MNFKHFDEINHIICVSDDDTKDIIYLNRYAQTHFEIASVPEHLKSAALLSGDDLQQDFFKAELQPGQIYTKFVPTLCGLPWPVVIESLKMPYEEKFIRIDTVRAIVDEDIGEDNLYTMLFESAYMYLDSHYHGVDFQLDNIRESLTAALSLYDAERAYVLDLDEDLEAGAYLCSITRDGYMSSESEYVDTMLFSNLFTDIIKKGMPFAFKTEELKASHPEEYAWLCAQGIFNSMGVPFTTRTEMVAFLVVDNVERFWKKTSFLSIAMRALFNELRAMHMLQQSVSDKHGNRELSEEDVVIKLFGGFEIHTKIGSLDLADFSSVQCSRFLLYLLKNRNRTIPVREIADVLWPEQLIDNPYNMVKGVAFRVRKILDSISPYKLVVAKSGTYALNDKLTLILDIESFDKLCDKIHYTQNSLLEKQHLYEKALRIYKGDMLPNYESEIWLIGWIGYYQMKYIDILKEYLSLLQETEQHSKIFEAVSNVLRIGYDDGDVYKFLIEALIKLNKPELAKSYYQRIEKCLTDEQRRAFTDLWHEYRK